MAGPDILSEPAGLQPELVIRPSKGWVSLNLKDLWRYRELVFFLTWRDISVRYKQTVLGAAWAILQPFFTMVVFSVFFGLLAKVPSDGLPYPVWNFCALVPWQLFAYSLAESGNSLVANQNLITKVYFPRVVIPIAATLGGLVDFAIAFVVLIGMMLFYHICADQRHLDPAAVHAVGHPHRPGSRPVAFRPQRGVPGCALYDHLPDPVLDVSDADCLPEQHRAGPASASLYGLNPMAGVVEGFRWALLGSGQAPGLDDRGFRCHCHCPVLLGAGIFQAHGTLLCG